MRIVKWIIIQASLIAVVLGISLSGFGMAQAHTATSMDIPVMDHGSHATMDYASHDMTPSDDVSGHEGHTNCPMIACCHTGGTATTSVPAMIAVITCQHALSFDLHLTNAEPESAKKPPKHA